MVLKPAPQQAINCWEENKVAVEASREGGGTNSIYIPECNKEGKFKAVQCYKVIK